MDQKCVDMLRVTNLFHILYWIKSWTPAYYISQKLNFYQKNTDFEQGSTGLHLATYLEFKLQHLRIF